MPAGKRSGVDIPLEVVDVDTIVSSIVYPSIVVYAVYSCSDFWGGIGIDVMEKIDRKIWNKSNQDVEWLESSSTLSLANERAPATFQKLQRAPDADVFLVTYCVGFLATSSCRMTNSRSLLASLQCCLDTPK